MCKLCVQAVVDYFPDCPSKEYGSFLMASTAFPFGKPTLIRLQLKEAKDAGCTTYKDAIVYAETHMDDQMKTLKELERKKNKSLLQL
jgi:hypothetical protein